MCTALLGDLSCRRHDLAGFSDRIGLLVPKPGVVVYSGIPGRGVTVGAVAGWLKNSLSTVLRTQPLLITLHTASYPAENRMQ